MTLLDVPQFRKGDPANNKLHQSYLTAASDPAGVRLAPCHPAVAPCECDTHCD